VVLEVVGYDHDRAVRVLRWPVRQLLLAAVAMLRKSAREAYQFDMVVWALIAPHSEKKLPPPPVPPILKDILRADP